MLEMYLVSEEDECFYCVAAESEEQSIQIVKNLGGEGLSFSSSQMSETMLDVTVVLDDDGSSIPLRKWIGPLVEPGLLCCSEY